ncbi:MAG TPA: type II secretion system F family protein [Pseudolysinimonas sp.]|nr:type II secretion system F family protein [Pseudolysinimonas sp.]
MIAWSSLAIPVGIVLGVGLWTLIALIPRVGAPRLATRVAPYLVDISAEAREAVRPRVGEPGTLIAGLMVPAGGRIRVMSSRLLGGVSDVEARLRLAGSSSSVDAFRSRQILGLLVGAACGVAAVAMIARTAALTPLLALLILAVGAALGALVPGQLLARQARARQARMAAELPTVLEFLALALSAGEGVLPALRRVASAGNGELAREFGRVVADVNAGMPLADSLTRCSSAVALPALTRTIDQLTGALERGSPLVEVFRAQAQDSREDTKQRLLETAGKKEVAMLVPLVFLILPVTVAFAIFPGIMVLQLGL